MFFTVCFRDSPTVPTVLSLLPFNLTLISFSDLFQFIRRVPPSPSSVAVFFFFPFVMTREPSFFCIKRDDRSQLALTIYNGRDGVLALIPFNLIAFIRTYYARDTYLLLRSFFYGELLFGFARLLVLKHLIFGEVFILPEDRPTSRILR